MLPKRSRVSKQTIERYLIRGRRIKTSRFLVLYTEISTNQTPQVSFTASKKIAKKAVLRNKLRRRGYEAVKTLIPHISPSAIILISYLSPDVKASISEVAEELKKALTQAKLLTK